MPVIPESKFLGRKIAGFPVWVWALLLLAAILLGLWFRSRRSMEETNPDLEDEQGDFLPSDDSEYFPGGSEGVSGIGQLDASIRDLIGILMGIEEDLTPLPRPSRPKKRRNRIRPGDRVVIKKRGGRKVRGKVVREIKGRGRRRRRRRRRNREGRTGGVPK